MKNGPILVAALLLGAGLGLAPYNSMAQDSKRQEEPRSRQNLVREVRHQLVLLPYYSVFDNLSFRVDGDTVVLEGQEYGRR